MVVIMKALKGNEEYQTADVAIMKVGGEDGG